MRNPRMAMPYRTLDRMTDERRTTNVREAAAFVASMDARPRAAVWLAQAGLFG